MASWTIQGEMDARYAEENYLFFLNFFVKNVTNILLYHFFREQLPRPFKDEMDAR
jgi:hypothetical protein